MRHHPSPVPSAPSRAGTAVAGVVEDAAEVPTAASRPTRRSTWSRHRWWQRLDEGAQIGSAREEAARRARLARLEDVLQLLESARSELAAGWVQAGWWAVRTPSGGRVVVSGLAAAVEHRDVTGVCLVGALLRAAGPQGPESGQGDEVGVAIDAVYDAVAEARGNPVTGRLCERVPGPQVRLAQVRELTAWNDRVGRTRDEVVAVLDGAVARTVMALVEPRPLAPAR